MEEKVKLKLIEKYPHINELFQSGEITLNGPAARRVAKGDIIIIIAYARMDFEEAKNFQPSLVFPDETNNSLS